MEEYINPKEMELENQFDQNHIRNLTNLMADNIAAIYNSDLGQEHNYTFEMLYNVAHDEINLNEQEFIKFVNDTKQVLQAKYNLTMENKKINSKLEIVPIKK